MTGPEHYREAERLLVEDVDYSQPDDLELVLAHAQVHATLALAAATAVPAANAYDGDEDHSRSREWADVA